MNQTADLLYEFIEDLMHYSMRDMFHYAKENNMSMPQIGALMQIYHKHTCAVSEVGSDMGVTNAAASQMLERLFQQNFVERMEDPIDRRVKQIKLTEKGVEFIKKAIKNRIDGFSRIIQTLTPEEEEQTRLVFNRMIERLKKLE